MLVKRILQIFDSFALAATLFLLIVVAFNILARQLFDLSSGTINLMIPGAIELSRYTLLLLVFAALPRAASAKMIRVDLLAKRLPHIWQHWLNAFWLILMAGFSAILLYLFSQKALLTLQRGDASQDLEMPLFYFYILISIASFATALTCLIKAFSPSGKPS